MHKRSFISFISLFIFWMVISGEINLEHIVVGIVLSAFVVWFWRDSGARLPGRLSPREILLFGRCIIMLVGYVIQSNIDVAKTLLFSNPSVTPMFIQMIPGIESNWGKVFLATCITITPGTVTVDVDPETNIFTIHALTMEAGANLTHWKLIDEIKKLETHMRGRKAHVVDTSRLHGSNSVSSIKGDHWTHRN